MIYSVAPLGGQTIGKAASREDAWWLCCRYGQKPFPLDDASAVRLEDAANGVKVWTVGDGRFPPDRARMAFSPAPSKLASPSPKSNGLGLDPRPFSAFKGQDDLLKRLGHVA